MESIPRGPWGISRNELSKKSLKILISTQKIQINFEKNWKKIQHWFYISKLGNNTKNWYWKTKKNQQISENFLKFSYLKEIQYFRVLGKFWRGFEEPRSDKIYSSGNWGVKKGLGPRGLRDEEFLVPSLGQNYNIKHNFIHFPGFSIL